jgi:hypothetical protein
MKLSKSYLPEYKAYELQVDPGEHVDISFHPEGGNAPAGRDAKWALSVRSRILPNGDIALTVDFCEPRLYKETPQNTGAAWLVIWSDSGPNRAEFALDQERPWDKLVLEKVDLQSWLKSEPEQEPSDD